MQPKITRVKWSAVNIPWGVVFDELTGTFTGRPEDVGEYVIPVTVETNYGKDTKDVKLIVTPPTYRVYSIGQNALTWSENAEPDEHGFYALNMPEAYELVAHYNGFGALTAGKKYYCCGPYRNYCAIGENSETTSLVEAKTPINLYEQLTIAKSSRTDGSSAGGEWFSADERRILPGVDRVIYVNYTYSYNSKGSATQYVWYTKNKVGNAVILWNSDLCEYVLYTSKVKYHYYTHNTKQNYTAHEESWEEFSPTYAQIPKISLGNGKTALDDKYYTSYTLGNIRCLLEDNTIWGYGTVKFPLGYTAIKPFDGTVFRALSANHYLDNKPENFPHGVIKDAWVYRRVAYVQTTANQLYEYVANTKTWNLLGTYDIKKAELPDANHIFILTRDGELYHKGHKGIVIAGLFEEAHETLTHIYPSLRFKDFTFGGNTLTVLRE